MSDFNNNGGFSMSDNRRNPFAQPGNQGSGGLTINKPFKQNTLGAHTQFNKQPLP